MNSSFNFKSHLITSMNTTSSNFEINREIFDYLIESVIVTTDEGKVLFVNKTFVSVYGYKEEEILDKDVSTVFPPKNNNELIEEIYNSTKNNPWEGTVKQIRRDGSSFKVKLKVFRPGEANNGESIIIFIANDLSERIKSQKEIKHYEDKLQTLFFEIKDAIYESTPEGKMIDINPSGVELFGYKNKRDLLRLEIAQDLYVNPQDRNKFKVQLEKEGYVKDYEIDIKKKNGEIATVLETAFAVRDEAGSVVTYRGILRDITDAKNYQLKLRSYINELAEVNKQLMKSEDELKSLNVAKDKFFSIVAHDLRSPFSSLMGYSEFLRDDLSQLKSDEIKLFANNIHQSAKTVFNLLRYRREE